MNGKNEEVSETHRSVQELINSTFTDSSLETCVCIQPPPKNSQMLSHIHMFRIKDIPKDLNENYYDCEVILKIKRDLLTMQRARVVASAGIRSLTPEKKSSSPRAMAPPRSDEDEPLTLTRAMTTRTTTPPRYVSSGLTRQSTNAGATTPRRDGENAPLPRKAMAR